MLQKKEYQQQKRYQQATNKNNVTKEGIPTTKNTKQHQQNLMLQKKEYQQQQ